MKLSKIAGLVALVTIAGPAMAAHTPNVESADTALNQIEPRSAHAMRDAGNQHSVMSDAVKWNQVWGAVTPAATGQGEPVHAAGRPVNSEGRS